MYSIKRTHPEEFNIIYADGNIGPNHVAVADLIVFHRAGHLHDFLHRVLKVWPKTKKRPVIVHDVDDNEFNLPNSHPMKGMWLAAGKDKMSLKSLKDSDLVTTTGKKLKQTFQNFNSNVTIFRNMFDWNMPMWKHERDNKYEGKVVIGWVGLTSHFADLKKMRPILKAIHDKYPNTHFIIAGMALKDTSINIINNPDGTQSMQEEEVKDETKTYKHQVKSLFKEFESSRVEFFDALPLEEYGRFYKDLDIGISFVERNTFSACKSEIKAVEYMKYGAVSVYSKWGGYDDMYNMMPDNLKKENFKLAIDSENPRQWIESISNIIDNLQLYKKFALDMKSWVEYHYNIDRNIDQRVEFYNKIIEEHNEKETNKIANYGILN